ncbi:MAG TPA: AsmA family protein [Candidatus Eisenbacteria bacterium]|nr:AsmA family protein [Candidatus Eisenbacteria bacterium]
MRKLVIAVVAVVVVLILALLSLPYFIDINQYRGEIQAQLQNSLHRPVQFGALSLGVFPLRVEAQNVVIGEDPRFHSSVPFAQVGEMDISLKLLPLLTKSIEMKGLTLKRPKLELIKDAAGVWNFSSLGQAPATPAPPGQIPPPAPTAPAQQTAPSKAPAASAGASFAIDELKITDGQVAVTDLQKREPRAVYDHIDLTVDGFAPNKQFEIELAAHIPGRGAETLSLAGKVGPLNQAQMLSTPFDGKLKLKEVSLAGAQKFLNVSALEGSDAMLSGTTDLVNSAGKMAARGSLKVDDAVVHNVTVGYPITAEFDVADDLNSDLLQIKQGEVKLGSTPLSLSGTLNTHGTPSVADLSVSAKDASIEDAARLAAAFGVAFNPNAKITGKLSANVHAQGPTNNLALNGTVNGRNLEVTGKDIPQAVKVPSLDLTMTPQEIRSGPFTATSGATTLAGQMTIAQYTTPSPTVDASFKTVNGKVDELLNIAKAYGVGAVEGISGSGAITLDLRATGPIKNTDAMTFSGTGAVQNATLKTPALTEPLHVRNANLQFTQNSLNFTNVNASIGSTNASGSLSMANFQAPRLTFAISADKLNITELQKLVAPAKPAPAKKAAASWGLVPAAEAAPAPQPSLLDTATGTGTIAVGTLIYDRTQLTNVHSGVTLNHGVIQLSPLTGQVYGGQIAGSINADLRHETSSFAVNAKLTGADANQLLSAVGNMKDTLYGTLSANLNQTFSTPASGDVTQTLNGPFSFTLTNGKLTKIDLLNELGKIGKFGGGSKGYTSISSMSGTFEVHNGVANTNDLKAALDVGSMAATGTINLVNEALGLHLTAVLDKAFSQSVGGTGVGGYLNTALGNKNGELVLPVIITGTMSHPVVGPDIEKIAQMKLNNIVPNAAGILGGKGGAGGILGTLLGGGQQPKQGQQPAKQAQPTQQQQLQDALGGLLGGSKKKPPK